MVFSKAKSPLFSSSNLDSKTTAQFFTARFLFLRSLGIIYFLAFWSLSLQILGLFGEEGIVPLQDTLNWLEKIKKANGMVSLEFFYRFPSLCWLFPYDGFLLFLCYGGAFLSLFVFLGIAVVPVLVLLWIFYLSLVTLGSTNSSFLAFQWDILLLEVGFISIFFAPLHFRDSLRKKTALCPFALFLLRWTLFRLMFTSGLFKLLSGDETWQTLTALHYHYETQPLTNWIAWVLHQFPGWFHRVSVLLMFVVQLLLPPLIFFPGAGRLIAFFGMFFLQMLIIVSGNYCFFNWFTIALCLLLVEDRYWLSLKKRLPSWGTTKKIPNPNDKFEVVASTTRQPEKGNDKVLLLSAFFTLLAVVVSLLQIANPFFSLNRFPLVKEIFQFNYSFHLVNRYGLFTTMTTSRPELILEGSLNGKNWKAYDFKWKVGHLKRKPSFVAPYHPRLDWQMWFVALRALAEFESPRASYKKPKWFLLFLQRLLDNSPAVLSLMERNPFGKRPPKFIRVRLYNYKFTNSKTLNKTGQWWDRSYIGEFLPPIQKN